ncbi:MAG: FtsX-like permease family protein [Nocardioides sp.]
MNTALLTVHAPLVRASGAVRPMLVVAATAPVAALALVAIAVLRLPANPSEMASNLLLDPAVRGGYLFGLTLVCIAPLALLYQAVRLGSASRERRLAALRVAGATPGDVRVLGALDVGLPAIVGAAFGYPAFVALRHLFGGQRIGTYRGGDPVDLQFRVVPVSVSPAWWEVALVIAALGLAGALIGSRALGGVVTEPLGTVSQVSRTAPRPWSLLLLVPALPLLLLAGSSSGSADVAQLALIAAISLGVVAMLGLGPSAAHLAGRWALRRTTSAEGLLAAARLVADPRASGRAAATVGVISLVSGFSAFFLTDVQRSGNGFDAFYVAPLVLVLVVLVAALLTVAVALAVHAAESAVDRKRATAALAAQGAGVEVVVAAHRREIELAVLPLATLGVVLGAVPANLIAGVTTWGLVLTPAFIVATVALAWVSALAATALARPAIERACSLENLRNG